MHKSVVTDGGTLQEFIGAYVPKHLKTQLEQEAKRSERTASGQLRLILNEHFRQQEPST
jgi:hypothetical protein